MFLRESSQDLEEEERGGKPLVLLLLSSLRLDWSVLAVEVEVEVEGRRVALWRVSRGVMGFDCLPKVKGKWALTPSYISASSSSIFQY